MEQFIPKKAARLENQLSNAEAFLGGKAGTEHERNEMLGLGLDEIKTRYPEKYHQYLSALKTEAAILHFPGINIQDNENPKISLLSAGARGYGFKIELANESHVIKPLETLTEKDISRAAGDFGIGPKQFDSNEGFLHEEFIEGVPLLKLDPKTCTEEFMESLGEKTKRALNKLHENNILVNDQILTDDFGKSHLIIDNQGDVRFIDFGASIDMSTFPNLSDDAVMSLMRTDGMMQFRLHNLQGASPEQVATEIQGYRENILSGLTSKEDLIQMKDMQLLGEGTRFLNYRLPNVASFVKGLQK